MSPKGCVYLIVLEENKPKELAAMMARYGFPHSKVTYLALFKLSLIFLLLGYFTAAVIQRSFVCDKIYSRGDLNNKYL